MADDLFWIWLQEALGAGSIKTDRVIRELGSPEMFYRMTRTEMADFGFAPKEVDKIKATGLDRAKENLRLAKRYGCSVITPDHKDYPENLAHIDGMPCVLYVLGDLSGLSDELVITMVGTRESNEYGEACAMRLSHDLAAAGCTVTSGLAVGIDYACHEGALSAGGRSIGMLACGMNVDYPLASRSLKRRILDRNGVLITEFPFGERAHRYCFNIRNRLLSGIASGVVVVQAPEQSGALNTARHALEQNKDVFAVPGGIFDPVMTGCNKLIQDGAKIVVNVYSILEEFIGRFPPSVTPEKIVEKVQTASGKAPVAVTLKSPRKVKPAAQDAADTGLLMVAQEPPGVPRKLDEAELAHLEISDTSKKIYALLDSVPAECETIADRTQFPVMEVMAAMTELELTGLVQALPGKRYIVRNPR